MAVAGLGAGDMLLHTWPPFEVLDIDGEMKTDKKKHNELIRLMRAALFAREHDKILPKILVHAIPTGGTDPRYESKLVKPKDKREFELALAKATSEGHLPRTYRAYLIVPSPEFFEALSVKAQTLLQDEKKDGTAKLEALKTFANSKVDKYILGVTEYNATPKDMGETTNTLFPVSLRGSTPAHWGGLSERREVSLSAADKKALKVSVGNDNRELAVRQAFNLWYYTLAWEFFKAYTTNRQVQESPWMKIHRTINLPEVRAKYDNAHNRKFAKAPEVPGTVSREKPNAPTTIPAPKGGVNLSKVVPSIAISGRANDIVTANPAERRWQRADGSYTQASPIPDQKIQMMIPADKITPLLRSGDFDVYYGIVYDHPLLFGGGRFGRAGLDATKHQVWWYTNRNQFIYSAYQYARLFGDHPHMVYRIVKRTGTKRGQYLSRAQFDKLRTPETLELEAEISKLNQAFKGAIQEGKRRYPVMIEQKLGLKGGDLKLPYNANAREVPEGLTPDAWIAFLRWLRRKAKTQLGLNLEASVPMEFIDIATGKRKKLQYSRHEIARDVARKRNQEFIGEKDSKGKATEPWGVYLVQYILGHKGDSSLAGQAFMVPLNIIRSSKVTLEPRRHVSGVKESDLRGVLRKYFGNLHFGKTESKWQFIRAHPNLPFPYARLVRPITVTNPDDLKAINDRIHAPGIKRTVHGYVIDGIEFDAYVMLVAMPPSAAQDKFGMIHKQAQARQIMTNPDMVARLRRTTKGRRVTMREFGLVNRRTKLQNWANRVGERDTGADTSTPYNRHETLGLDPNKTLGIPDATTLPPGYYMSEVGKIWKPHVQEILNDAGRVVQRAVIGYENAVDPEQRKAYYDMYAKEAAAKYLETKNEVINYIQALVRVSKKYDPRNETIMDNIGQYIRYVKHEVDPATGSYFRIPAVINQIGLTDYHAPFGSVRGNTQMMKIKAPSEDVAKMLILYRLMRRSAHNKTVGKLMNMRKFQSNQRLFPDINARILAQWAKTGFIVIPDRGTRTRYLRHTTQMHAKDQRVQRAAEWGDHRFARMLRTD